MVDAGSLKHFFIEELEYRERDMRPSFVMMQFEVTILVIHPQGMFIVELYLKHLEFLIWQH